jgi:uncharacterized protein (TIGR03437 family)
MRPFGRRVWWATLLMSCGVFAVPLASTQIVHPPAIASISVCSPTGAEGSGSCPSGTFDTAQIVLAPDGSGNAINAYGVGATSDEHSSVFSPGTLGSNGDYVFFVASGTSLNPDVGMTVLSGGSGPDRNGQWTFNFAAADNYGSYSLGFGTVFLAPTAQNRCPTVADGNPAHQDQTFDLNYAAPGSVVIDPTSAAGSLIMIYEGTNTCLGSTGGTSPRKGAYITLGAATSLDYGHTWPSYRASPSFSFVPLPDANKTQGPNAPAGALGNLVCMGTSCAVTPAASYGRYAILSPQPSLASLMATGNQLGSLVGDSEPSAFVDDVSSSSAPYLYAVHGYLSSTSGVDGDLTLARAQLNGGTAPLTFAKWNGQSFSSPGVGGVEAAILPSGSFQNCRAATQSRHSGSIDYVDTTAQYLLIFVCDSPTDPAAGAGSSGARGSAWFYATSYDVSDPTQWTTPQEITGSFGPWDSSGGCVSYKGWYPTLMSLGSKPGHLSTSGYVFYLWGCEGGAGDTSAPKRQFSSRAFTITTASATPAISLVANAEGQSPMIAPNTWVEIKGSNLAPVGVSSPACAPGYCWQASDFVNNQMPTQLDQVSATVNGKHAYVYYISPNQVNILTPPDAMSRPVNVVLTNNGATSSAFIAQAQALSPSLFVFDGTHVAATHLNGSLLGPTTLYPGSSTPAKPGETVVLYGNGFGPTNVPVTSGSVSQSGTLSPLPAITIGGVKAAVSFAGLVAPGEFQFNVVVPSGLSNGDQSITATYSGQATQAGTLITIQN